MSAETRPDEPPIRVGVSTCLLGEGVRYDGGHKRDRFVTDQLGTFVEWVPVCPELEAGLGVPRPSMRLVAMTRVKVYRDGGMPVRDGVGLFAKALLDTLPELPVEDEGRLNDARLRENFIERLFAYRRLRNLFIGRWTHRDVVAFHTAHKLQLMAHSTVGYRSLGRRVAALKNTPRAEFRARYSAEFMATLAKQATPGRNANVLQHAAGHLKKEIPSASRTELAELIHDYRRTLVPLVVPMTLLRHHARAHDISYLNGQTFLEPHPKELMLRNHV
jgi:uncharacterized protein YbgA (DUF1722 family)/uncharacterized protein YbbK (DUF523 family)